MRLRLARSIGDEILNLRTSLIISSVLNSRVDFEVSRFV